MLIPLVALTFLLVRALTFLLVRALTFFALSLLTPVCSYTNRRFVRAILTPECSYPVPSTHVHFVLCTEGEKCTARGKSTGKYEQRALTSCFFEARRWRTSLTSTECTWLLYVHSRALRAREVLVQARRWEVHVKKPRALLSPKVASLKQEGGSWEKCSWDKARNRAKQKVLGEQM